MTSDNKEVVDRSEVVILAVKPNVIPSVLKEIAGRVSMQHLVISVALGIPLYIIEQVRNSE